MANMHNEIEYVFNLLENHRLKEALVQIHAMASQCSSWQLRTDVETLQTTYDLMLQYNAKGIKDPKQKDMYNKIFRSAYEMAERTHIMKNSTSSFALYYDLIRTYEHAKPHTLSELQMQLEAYTEDAATAPLIYSDANRCKSELAGIRERHEKHSTSYSKEPGFLYIGRKPKHRKPRHCSIHFWYRSMIFASSSVPSR